MPCSPSISCSYLPLLLTRLVHWITGSVFLIRSPHHTRLQPRAHEPCLLSQSAVRGDSSNSSSSMNPMHLSLTVDGDSLHEDAIVIARHVRPEWKNCDVRVRTFTDGITNRLVGCFLSHAPNDVLLVRVYGEKTELIIDRKAEKRNMMMMSSRQLAPQLFASFTNGLCYGFTPGSPIDVHMVRDPVISRLIAQKMARMHFIMNIGEEEDYDGSAALTQRPDSPSPWLLSALDRYLTYIPDSSTSATSAGILVPQKSQLVEEVSFLKRVVAGLSSPVVFCHNDLLLKNIIYHNEPIVGPGVTFIDFEYAAYNFQAFDIANHFCEFAGVEVYDPSLYPDVELQKSWLRNYLLAWKELNTCHESHQAGSKACDGISAVTVSEEEVMSLSKQVEKFTLASHLLWCIWAMIQSQHSTIHFDFQRYAYQRLQQYYADKAKIRRGSQNGH